MKNETKENSFKIKNLLSALFRWGLSAALLVYLFSKIDIDETIKVLLSANWVFLFYAAIPFAVIHLVLLKRWHVLIKAFGLDIPLKNIIRYFFIGLFGNLFLPSAIGGDLIKAVGLCRGHSQKAKVVASVLLDRISGFGGIVLIATLAFLFGFKVINDLSLLVSITIMAGVSIILLLVLFNKKLYSLCCAIFTPMPKLKQSIMQMHYDITLLKGNLKALYKAVGLSCVSQGLLAVCWYFLALALNQDVALGYFLIFLPLICVASSVPSQGGLGVREAASAFLFAKVGMESGVAVSMSLINYLFMVLVGLIGGVVFLFTKAAQHHDAAVCGNIATAQEGC